MRFGSLFSGIGGLDLGLERAGMECAFQVEIDDYCQKVLTKHWPDVPKFRDIKEVTEDELRACGTIDLVCGGFPCQDISIAGKREGITGARSGLWKEYLRIIRILRPRFVLVENVAALLERGIGVVLGDLAESGYDAEWQVLRASDFGAPHRRERVFIIAYPRGYGIQGYFETPISRFPEFSRFQNVRGVEDLRGRSSIPEPLFRGDRDGVSGWMERLKGCGNAVVPAIAQYIGEQITRCNDSPKTGDFVRRCE